MKTVDSKKSILSKINGLASSLMAFNSLFSSIQHREPHKGPTKTGHSQHQQTHFWVSNPDKTAPAAQSAPPYRESRIFSTKQEAQTRTLQRALYLISPAFETARLESA
ncbi:hypothetical protein [Alcaligenes aquatilis]|uniref:hypothetical protein n=1 Tax=Alcaligenes aquatilis TaxID=323284 RepID=UPI0037507CBC